MGASDRKKTGHREITTHVSIHTIHLDGLRELYRHFLRLPDGAVVEVSEEYLCIVGFSLMFTTLGYCIEYMPPLPPFEDCSFTLSPKETH